MNANGQTNGPFLLREAFHHLDYPGSPKHGALRLDTLAAKTTFTCHDFNLPLLLLFILCDDDDVGR